MAFKIYNYVKLLLLSNILTFNSCAQVKDKDDVKLFINQKIDSLKKENVNTFTEVEIVQFSFDMRVKQSFRRGVYQENGYDIIYDYSNSNLVRKIMLNYDTRDTININEEKVELFNFSFKNNNYWTNRIKGLDTVIKYNSDSILVLDKNTNEQFIVKNNINSYTVYICESKKNTRIIVDFYNDSSKIKQQSQVDNAGTNYQIFYDDNERIIKDVNFISNKIANVVYYFYFNSR
jgi:hypothetical protein